MPTLQETRCLWLGLPGEINRQRPSLLNPKHKCFQTERDHSFRRFDSLSHLKLHERSNFVMPSWRSPAKREIHILGPSSENIIARTTPGEQSSTPPSMGHS
jgi:hypothetical protein